MKLLIVAGGGGHFAPALAVIESLPKDVDVMVIGRKYAFEGDKAESLEYQTAKKMGLNFFPLTTGRLQRKLTRHSLVSLTKVPVGYFQSLKVLRLYQPDVVLSFGGYVSLPVAFAAKTLGIPIVVHEQILGAGLANKIVANFAYKVCVSWKESAQFFPANKVVVTGNPIRKNSVIARSEATRLPMPGTGGQPKQSYGDGIAALLSVARNDDKKIVYVTGGSGGAHGINVLIEDALEKLLGKYIVIHQTGAAKEFGDFDRLNAKRESLPAELKERYIVTKFVDPQEVWSIMDKADLVVARSGINTIIELLSLGKPCLLIPLPHGQHNEQLTNALFVKQAGIGQIAKQPELSGEELYNRIRKMIEKIELFREHSKSAKALVIPDAAASVINVVTHVNTEKKVTRS